MFELHHRLASESSLVHESNDWLLLLANDARYPWLILVPKVDNVREIYELDDHLLQDFYRLSTTLGAELMSLFGGDKLNVAALGNEVSQLHVHHIVRFETDEAWPAPVWGRGESRAYAPDDRAKRMNAMRAYLSFCQ